MRLRKLYLEDYRIINDLRIQFQPESKEHDYALDFLVGVNGTGKSTVLRAIGKIFQHFEGNKENPLIPFHFFLEYELNGESDGFGYRIIRISNLPQDIELDETGRKKFNVAKWIGESLDSLQPVRSLGSHLPSKIIAFTTGDERDWEIRQPEKPEAEGDPDVVKGMLPEERAIREQPVGTILFQRPNVSMPFYADHKFLFIKSDQMPLVALCGILADLRCNEDMRLLNDVFREAGIGRLQGFSLRFRINEVTCSNEDREYIEELARLTDDHRRLAAGSDRLIVFDLTGQESRVANSFFSSERSPMSLFERLAVMAVPLAGGQRLLNQVNLFFERSRSKQASRPGEKVESPPLHLWEWLSDGERSFIGRMSLFCLLDGQESLILLDEPEVHFNDYWKRQVVYLLNNVLKSEPSHLLISSHSSITLTDVRREDILVLEREHYQTKNAYHPQFRTLAADPSDIMVHVFGTEQAAGKYGIKSVQEELKERPNETQKERSNRLREFHKNVSPGYWSYRIRRDMLGTGGLEDAS